MDRGLIEKANNFRRLGENHLADQIYDRLLNSEPDNVELIFCKAMNIIDADPAKAIQLFEKVIELNPEVPGVFENIAIIANKSGLFDLAISIFNKGIEANPNNLDLLYDKATLIGNQGNYIQSLIDFYKVVDESTFVDNPDLFESHRISKDIEICKVHLRLETQQKKIKVPIPNEKEIRGIKIKEYEYPLPLVNQTFKNYHIDFGKHMGHSIKEILRKEPDYLIWCILNLHSFCVSEEIMEILSRKKRGIAIAENVNLFKLIISRDEIPNIDFEGDPPDSFSIDENGDVIY